MKIKINHFVFLAFSMLPSHSLNALTIKLSQAQLQSLGMKIWDNECKKSVEKLTWWGIDEPCASMGIGHFLWYPHHGEQKFTQTFDQLLVYLKKNGTALPSWLTSLECPWRTRSEFFANSSSKPMKELRTLLSSTIELQTRFIVDLFIEKVTQLLNTMSIQQKKLLEHHLEKLLSCAQGMYAVIDYANFKGFGTNPKERYQNQGWGLLQVLQDMHQQKTADKTLKEFIRVATLKMELRVKLSNPVLNEKRFLVGWIKRITTYAC